MMIFQYNYEYRIKKLLKLVNLRSLYILDYGCGIGNWNEKDVNFHSIKKITLYDKNLKLAKFLKKKYNSKKINITFSYKEILKKKNFNLVILSSVIQYISPSKLKVLINKLSKNNKKLILLFQTYLIFQEKLNFYYCHFSIFKDFFLY